MVSGAAFVKMYRFPLEPWPKILLTAVFISPIMRGERPRAASAGKTLETPGKASNPAVCGPPLGPQLPRPQNGLKQPLIHCGQKCVQTNFTHIRHGMYW